jgi:hypothetical protein
MIWMLILGILIGWLTKIPWLWKVYVEMDEKKQHIDKQYKNILKNLDREK